MQGIQQVMKDLLTNPNILASDDHHCEVCKRFVPKLEVDILGIKRTVQPKCKCETEKWAVGRKKAQEYDAKRKIEEKFSISNLGQRFAECTFDSFLQRPGTEKVVKNAKAYVEHFNDIDSEGLIIWGVPGNGKSHLAASIAHDIKSKYKTVVFQTVPELLERIRSTFNSNQKESEKEIMDALLHCDLLILDDIGSEKVSDWVMDIVFRIVDGRYRQKRPIIYTTNLNPKDLRFKLDERTYDRMVETSTIIENQGTSYRREIAAERFNRLNGESNG